MAVKNIFWTMILAFIIAIILFVMIQDQVFLDFVNIPKISLSWACIFFAILGMTLLTFYVFLTEDKKTFHCDDNKLENPNNPELSDEEIKFINQQIAKKRVNI